MLELLDKDFKAVMITILSVIKENMIITNEKRGPLSSKIENMKKEANGKF